MENQVVPYQDVPNLQSAFDEFAAKLKTRVEC